MLPRETRARGTAPEAGALDPGGPNAPAGAGGSRPQSSNASNDASELYARVGNHQRLVVRRLLWVLMLIAAGTLSIIVWQAGAGSLALPAFYVNLFILPVLWVAHWLNHHQRTDQAIFIVTAILLLAGAVPVLMSSLSRSPLSMLIFAVPIVLTGLVSSRRALVLSTAAAVGTIIFATGLQALRTPGNAAAADPEWGFALQAVILLLLIGYFLDRFGFVFRATLTDALEAQMEVQKSANERIRSQAALIDQQRFTESIVENLPGIFTLLSQDGRFTRWNRNFQRSLGLTEDELNDASIDQILVPEDHQRMKAHMRQVFQDGVGTTEVTLVTGNGERVPHFLQGARITLDGKDYIALVALDRSEISMARSRIEQLNQELEERLERITALHEIDRAITGSLDLRLTLDVVLQQVTRRLRIDAASILLFRSSDYRLVFGASRGLSGNQLHHTSLRLGEGLAGRAALERDRLVIDDPEELARTFPQMSSAGGGGFQSYVATPLIAKGQLQGVLEIFHRTPLPATDEWHHYLSTLATQAAIAVENAALFDNLERSNLELRLAYDRTIEGWARALDLRDEETEGHSRRVTDMTVELAERMGVSDDDLVHIRRGALLHDIGKMGIPDSILLKPAALNEEEWEIMKRHPVYAVELLSPIEFLAPALAIPRSHHERWDGSGYPLGLEGMEIPLAARIFAVVDVFDALTSDRPYRPAWSVKRALDYIAEESGKQFDPEVVAQFLAMIVDRSGLTEVQGS